MTQNPAQKVKLGQSGFSPRNLQLENYKTPTHFFVCVSFFCVSTQYEKSCRVASGMVITGLCSLQV